MSAEKSENESGQWFSTYGLITAERILGKYKIKLVHEDLLKAMKSPFSFYHKILEIPLKHVLNGIVLQQANDYHVYAQKVLIDYLLSGENAKDEAAQGAATREEIENERQKLVDLGEEYHHMEGEHNNLIAESQAALIKITAEFNTALENGVESVVKTLKNVGLIEDKNKVRHAVIHALIYCDLVDPQLQSNEYLFIDKMNDVFQQSFSRDVKKKITDNLYGVLNIVQHFGADIHTFREQTNEMALLVNSYRKQFFETILRLMNLISLLPEYKINPIQDVINRESLYFDKSIGALL